MPLPLSKSLDPVIVLDVFSNTFSNSIDLFYIHWVCRVFVWVILRLIERETTFLAYGVELGFR